MKLARNNVYCCTSTNNKRYENTNWKPLIRAWEYSSLWAFSATHTLGDTWQNRAPHKGVLCKLCMWSLIFCHFWPWSSTYTSCRLLCPVGNVARWTGAPHLARQGFCWYLLAARRVEKRSWLTFSFHYSRWPTGVQVLGENSGGSPPLWQLVKDEVIHKSTVQKKVEDSHPPFSWLTSNGVILSQLIKAVYSPHVLRVLRRGTAAPFAPFCARRMCLRHPAPCCRNCATANTSRHYAPNRKTCAKKLFISS